MKLSTLAFMLWLKDFVSTISVGLLFGDRNAIARYLWDNRRKIKQWWRWSYYCKP